jgi:mannose-6-phosphate isomerase-like protein (cupin superfamily)
MNESEEQPGTDEAPNPLDAMRAAPDHHRILIENERVRILDTSLAPGERTPLHAHPWPAALYVLSWSDFIRYDPDDNILVDSRAMSQRPAVGEALWSAPLPPHYVRNIGDAPLHIIAVEMKPG